MASITFDLDHWTLRALSPNPAPPMLALLNEAW